MWPNPQETADLATIIEEILHEKLHFLCSDPPLTRNLQTTVPYELPIFFNIVFSGRYHVHQINEGTRNCTPPPPPYPPYAFYFE